MGLHDQVKVVGHQACREDRQLLVLLGFRHQRDECSVVGGFMEYLGTTIGSIQYVVAVVRDDRARRTWHVRRLISSRRDNRYEIWPIRTNSPSKDRAMTSQVRHQPGVWGRSPNRRLGPIPITLARHDPTDALSMDRVRRRLARLGLRHL